mmetsp:Transcript_25164/g.63855  ORF Transcript_25164/g.63855 Transcript_25164/m.63855 type:complete len:330 (+) Transcript_25164:171-1160(+)
MHTIIRKIPSITEMAASSSPPLLRGLAARMACALGPNGRPKTVRASSGSSTPWATSAVSRAASKRSAARPPWLSTTRACSIARAATSAGCMTSAAVSAAIAFSTAAAEAFAPLLLREAAGTMPFAPCPKAFAGLGAGTAEAFVALLDAFAYLSQGTTISKSNLAARWRLRSAPGGRDTPGSRGGMCGILRSWALVVRMRTSLACTPGSTDASVFTKTSSMPSAILALRCGTITYVVIVQGVALAAASEALEALEASEILGASKLFEALVDTCSAAALVLLATAAASFSAATLVLTVAAPAASFSAAMLVLTVAREACLAATSAALATAS